MMKTISVKYNCAKFILIFFGFSILSFQSFAQSFEDSLLDFIVKNKSRSSLSLSVNDTTIVSLNGDKPMPLAQTENLMIAIEFAKQAGLGMINEDAYIPLSDLDKYYIPQIDNAQTNWLDYERGEQFIEDDAGDDAIQDEVVPFERCPQKAGEEDPPYARGVGHRILFAADKLYRLRSYLADSALARHQPEWILVRRYGSLFDLAGGSRPAGESCLHLAARRAKRAEWAAVGISLQLSDQ